MLLKELEDPELKGLASRLPTTILYSWADSTSKKYLNAFKRWKNWAALYQFDLFQQSPGVYPGFL